MASGPRVGDRAPDFTLGGTDGPFRLSDHRGRCVVLLFYPGDETPVCTRQFSSYRDRDAEMGDLDAVVVGISHQDLDAHRAFTQHHALTVPLLADVGRAVADAYGVTAPVLGTRRATIVVDEEGIVRYRHVYRLGLGFHGVDDLCEVLDSLPARA
jgi:thioredoxin-dependent peroxiredoxin